MENKDFVHLHLHTQYSLLDGASVIKKLIPKVKELGMDSIAITDHGVMYGVIDFYKEAKAAGIKPIIGCEVYVAPHCRLDKIYDIDNDNSHLVLLCENEIGYQNLIYMVSQAFTEGFYYKPRVDLELLKSHSTGLIALSACLAGGVCKALVRGDYKNALSTAKQYKDIFGKDNYFIELQDHGLREQKAIIPQLISIAKELELGLVATNDVHYVEKNDSSMQDVLMCIQTGKTVDDTDRMKMGTDEFYLKSPSEMQNLFQYANNAIENTVKIAKRCNLDFEFGVLKLPEFDLPKCTDHFEYFKNLAYSGLEKRYENITPEIIARLEFELNTIKNMGYVDYFLIVWDFIRFARESKIEVGPGRGSGAGSLIAYCLWITNVDPILYNLIFERFLNPERVSMPDFDIDFCYVRRQEVIDYVVSKYGSDRVAQIITFGTLQAKAAIRDVGRALNMSYSDVDIVAKLIPSGIGVSIGGALTMSSQLMDLYDNDRDVKKLIDTAKKLEGMPRHASTHAAGVVISKNALNTYVPLQTNDNIVTTQFTVGTLEELGILKMDFLGLRNLTVIRNTINLIEENTKEIFDVENIDYNNKLVYGMLCRGDTEGVFQLEGTGAKKQFIKDIKVQCLEDIIAATSLHRPGPMEQIPRYIKNKNNPSKITYKHPILEKILNVTYGCVVYQEQVMRIFVDIAGYSVGRADLIRRAMSKKKKDVMESERKIFIHGIIDENGKVLVDGAIRRGISENVAEEIYEDLIDFASYAFSKSHAAPYAVLAYQTAYFKALYPTEYMAAILTSIMGSRDKTIEYVNECNKLGIKILPPSINKSGNDYKVERDNNGHGFIRFPLSAIKNVGDGFASKVEKEVESNGVFVSFRDFCSRMSKIELNKRAVEAIIKCGCFDCLNINRSVLISNYEVIIDDIQNSARRNIEGQISLFGSNMTTSENSSSYNSDNFEYKPDMELMQLLSLEQEYTGLYLSAHPLDNVKEIVSMAAFDSANIMNSLVEETEDGGFNQINFAYKDGDTIALCGIVTNYRTKIIKNGEKMGFFDLEDLSGVVPIIVFSRIFPILQKYLGENTPIVVYGRVSIREDEPVKIVAVDVKFLQDESYKDKKLYLKLDKYDNFIIERIKKVLKKRIGITPVCIYIADTKQKIMAEKSYWITPTIPSIQELKILLGNENVKFN